MKFETILIPLGTAMAMAMTQYVAKMKNGEPFNIKKFGRTMAAGVGTVVVAWLTDNQPDLAQPESVAGVAGVVGGFDVLSKFVWRLFSKKG